MTDPQQPPVGAACSFRTDGSDGTDDDHMAFITSMAAPEFKFLCAEEATGEKFKVFEGLDYNWDWGVNCCLENL